MNRTQRQAILLTLIQQLRDNGSWCGETHIQKSAYFLQELLGVPLELNVIFYKHGPYSFDLGDEVTALRCDLLLSLQSREPVHRGEPWPTEHAAAKLLFSSSAFRSRWRPMTTLFASLRNVWVLKNVPGKFLCSL